MADEDAVLIEIIGETLFGWTWHTPLEPDMKRGPAMVLKALRDAGYVITKPNH